MKSINFYCELLQATPVLLTKLLFTHMYMYYMIFKSYPLSYNLKWLNKQCIDIIVQCQLTIPEQTYVSIVNTVYFRRVDKYHVSVCSSHTHLVLTSSLQREIMVDNSNMMGNHAFTQILSESTTTPSSATWNSWNDKIYVSRKLIMNKIICKYFN